MSNLIIKNAKIVTPQGCQAVKGKDMGNLKIIEQGCLIIKNGWIEYAGKTVDFLEKGYEILDAQNNVVLPGFVDSHTHLIFGGFRENEFRWRLEGESYMSIMGKGGGIQSTVDATRQSSSKSLFQKALWFLDRMSEMGVTTVEAKSGYGLSVDEEVKMIDIINQLAQKTDSKIKLVATFLGAHAVPKEYKGRTGEYIDLIIKEMLPKLKGRAAFCDIFCEKDVFELEDTERLLSAAKKMGFKLKLHADEIVSLGGGELSADLNAVSADHLLHVSDKGIKRMAEEGVVATLLPLTAFALKESYAPARKFIDAGASVALATDLNPGSCFSGSIPLTIALACIYMRMSIEETITALTLNGAAALDMADTIGSLEEGKRGDIIILGSSNYNVLPYYIGMNCVKTTIHNGKIVANNP